MVTGIYKLSTRKHLKYFEWKDKKQVEINKTSDIINKRMSLAEKEFAQKDKFDYQIINNELEKAIIELENIINLERGIKC